MAKYAISNEGLDALRTLATNLQVASDDIILSSSKLINEINGLEDGLGVYYEHILLLVEKILLSVKQAKEGDDGVDALSQVHIPRWISAIEELYGLGSGSESDDELAHKVLTLKRTR